MASDKINVSVAVEPIIHKALCDFAQHVLEEHGVQLLEVTFDWLYISRVDGQKFVVTSVQMDTKTVASVTQTTV